jgi:hypothetical protein
MKYRDAAFKVYSKETLRSQLSIESNQAYKHVMFSLSVLVD